MNLIVIQQYPILTQGWKIKVDSKDKRSFILDTNKAWTWRRDFERKLHLKGRRDVLTKEKLCQRYDSSLSLKTWRSCYVAFNLNPDKKRCGVHGKHKVIEGVSSPTATNKNSYIVCGADMIMVKRYLSNHL